MTFFISKTASALRARAVESLIGGTGGAAGGAYAEKRTRKTDEYGQEVTDKDRKTRFIAGGAVSGILGTAAGSKLKRALKKRRARKDYEASTKELQKAVDDTREDLKDSSFSALRLKKKRKLRTAEKLLEDMKNAKPSELAKDYKKIDSSVFGGKQRFQKGDKDFYKNVITNVSRMKDSL